MTIDDPRIISLGKSIAAAHEEFDLAVAFHETWKPTAYDKDLQQRMGTSYATNTFNVIRAALRREMVLALMRLWDKRKGTVRMEQIAQTLREGRIIDALAAQRARRYDWPGVNDEMRKDLGQKAAQAIGLIDKYSVDGSHRRVREGLKRLRDERFAHRSTSASTTGPDATDEEIEAFYEDNSQLISLLLSLVLATAYDPTETGDVFRHHAGFFWASARGERTEGHPNYRAPPKMHA